MAVTQALRSKLLPLVKEAAKNHADIQAFYKEVTEILSQVPHYNWVGFYLMQGGPQGGVLVLGPYVGRPTRHVRINVGQGICGRAVAEASTIVVDDVTKESNYLACSLETLSEIVVPIWVKGQIVGEIDIDSDSRAAFDESDRQFLTEVAEIAGNKLLSSGE